MQVTLTFYPPRGADEQRITDFMSRVEVRVKEQARECRVEPTVQSGEPSSTAELEMHIPDAPEHIGDRLKGFCDKMLAEWDQMGED